MAESRLPNGVETARRIERSISPERFALYRQECGGDRVAALELYRWNGELSGAFWETLGHVEVVLRNAIAPRMDAHQRRRGRSAHWLEDPAIGLHPRARSDIVEAQRRVRTKGKAGAPGQVVSELSFGFWRFLLAQRYQAGLWPDVASGFPHAPSRSRRVVEDPVVRLHEFRNRLAHHQRVWSDPVAEHYNDCLLLVGFVDPVVRDWIGTTSRVPVVLAARPA